MRKLCQIRIFSVSFCIKSRVNLSTRLLLHYAYYRPRRGRDCRCAKRGDFVGWGRQRYAMIAGRICAVSRSNLTLFCILSRHFAATGDNFWVRPSKAPSTAGVPLDILDHLGPGRPDSLDIGALRHGGIWNTPPKWGKSISRPTKLPECGQSFNVSTAHQTLLTDCSDSGADGRPPRTMEGKGTAPPDVRAGGANCGPPEDAHLRLGRPPSRRSRSGAFLARSPARGPVLQHHLPRGCFAPGTKRRSHYFC